MIGGRTRGQARRTLPLLTVVSVSRFAFQYNPSLQPRALVVFGCISKRVTHGQIKQIIRILSKASPLLSIDRVRHRPAAPAPGSCSVGADYLCPASSPSQGLESCLKGPDNYNSQVLIEATVIALTKLQPLLSKVPEPPFSWVQEDVGRPPARPSLPVCPRVSSCVQL